MFAKHNLMKFFSAFEVEEKMEMSLYFLCDEPFTMEHQSDRKNIKIFMMDVDDEA